MFAPSPFPSEPPKHQRIRLENSNAHLQSFFENAPIPLTRYDATGRIMQWNRPFEALLERSKEKIEGQHIFELLAEKNSEERMQSMVNTVFTGEALTEIHWKIKTAAGMIYFLVLIESALVCVLSIVLAHPCRTAS